MEWSTATRPGRRAAGASWLAACVGAMFLVGCTSSANSSATVTSTPLKGQIVFAGTSTSDEKHSQIYLERADGTHVRQLVHSNVSDVHPYLSSDGRRVVFTRQDGLTPNRIFVVSVDGTGLEQILASNCPDRCGDSVDGNGWSPDGRRLAFTRAIYRRSSTKPSTIDVWVMNADGSKAHRVTQQAALGADGKTGAQDGEASWSPDGKLLLFTHWEHSTGGSQDQFGVETVKPDGSGRREVTPLDVQGGEAVWSPDGALIAFQSPPDDEGVVKNLYTIRPDGTGMTALTFSFDGADADHPSWSPDGRQLVFSLVPAKSSTGADLYVIDRDGGDPRPIAATTLNETAPSWSPEPS